MNTCEAAMCGWGEAPATSGSAFDTLSSRQVYCRDWIRVREDHILLSNGQEGIYCVIDKHPCVIILPIDNGRVWLVEQFRYTIGDRALELPPGKS